MDIGVKYCYKKNL